jgi:hypothetical protein
MGTGMFKDKPISEFLERMKRSPIADSWITLKKGNRTLIWGGSTLVIFRCLLRADMVIIIKYIYEGYRVMQSYEPEMSAL